MENKEPKTREEDEPRIEEIIQGLDAWEEQFLRNMWYPIDEYIRKQEKPTGPVYSDR